MSLGDVRLINIRLLQRSSMNQRSIVLARAAYTESGFVHIFRPIRHYQAVAC
jgi:hypothetical protein